LPYTPLVRKHAWKLAPTVESPIGEHIRYVREQRKLLQKDAAEQMGVDVASVHNWETSKTQPVIVAMAGVIRFLGYYPFQEPQTLSERMLAYRRLNGLAVTQAADRLGVDEGTWRRWEHGERTPWPRFAKRLTNLFGTSR
jgi:transcriptional regulator with XRE-family HTH domain